MDIECPCFYLFIRLVSTDETVSTPCVSFPLYKTHAVSTPCVAGIDAKSTFLCHIHVASLMRIKRNPPCTWPLQDLLAMKQKEWRPVYSHWKGMWNGQLSIQKLNVIIIRH